MDNVPVSLRGIELLENTGDIEDKNKMVDTFNRAVSVYVN